MNNVLKSFFKTNNIDYNNKKFILAVSTGIDSAVLLDAFVKLKKECHTNNIVIDIIIAHVNHHIRNQSDIEEEYIKNYANKNNLKCFVKGLNFDGLKDNFESTARKKRYQFFLELMEKERADYLVLAHHGCDNIETIMMRIMRGSSLTGYSGMQEITIMQGYNVIRPFLNISRTDIEAYQKDNNIVFFEDETNSLNDYTRNRIRKTILPKMFEESSDLINKFSEFRKTIYEASKIVNNVRDEFIASYVINSDEIIIDRNAYLNLNDFMKEEVLFEILKPYSLSKSNIKELIKIIESDNQNYFQRFKNLFNFIIEYNKIIISNKEIQNYIGEVKIEKPGVYNFGDKKVICVLEKNNKSNYNLDEMWYNINMLPVLIRYRKEGDKMIINGKGKKLKDIFIDMKVPVLKRNNTVLCVKDNQVLMAFGMKKSDLLKAKFEENIKITIMEE